MREKMTNKEEVEEKLGKDSEEDIEEHSGEEVEQVGQEEETPLEAMTKAELLEQVGIFKDSAETKFDLYLRSQAEIDNLKKRFQKEKQDLAKFSNESLIKRLLIVTDNLEKAVLHAENENSFDVLIEGVKLTLKGLTDTLQKEGLEEITAVGESFDPNYHEAVSAQEDKTVEPGTVLEELQKGYILNQRLIRPAMVIVSKAGV